MKKQQFMKTFSLIFILVLLAGLLIVPVSAADPKYDITEIETELSFESEPGSFYERAIKQGRLTLKNNTPDTLEGTIELHFYQSYYYGSDPVDYAVLELPLELTGGIAKTTTFVTDFMGSADQCRVELYEKNGKLLLQQDIQLSSYNSAIRIGWMTDNPKEADILNRNLTSDLRCVPLTADYFPVDFEVMKQYNLIIVNGADLSASSAYSAKQLALLKKYISEGGRVIVGTGRNKDQLQFFSDYFAGSVDKAISASTESFSYASFATDMNQCLSSVDGLTSSILVKPDVSVQWFRNEITLSDVSLSFSKTSLCAVVDDNFKPCSSKAGMPGICFYKAKESNLYLCNMDLGVQELLNSSQSDLFLLGLFGNAGIALNNPFLQDMPPVIDWYEMEAFGPSGLNPVVPILLLVLYGAVGILLPFILSKAKGKPKIALLGIPSAAILCSVMIVMFGMIRHGFVPYSYTVAVAELEKDGEATVQVSVKTAGPGGGKKTVSFGKENTVYYTSPYNNVTNTNLSLEIGSRVTTEGTGSVQTPASVSSWDNSFAYGYFRDQYNGAFDVNVTFDASSKTYTLSVRNNTGKDLTNAAVYVFTNTILIGDFPAGETRTFSDLGYTYEAIDLQNILKTFFYAPNGLSDAELNADLLSIINYQKGFSYYYGYGNVLSLNNLYQKDEQDAINALALIKAALTYRSDDKSVLILGTDPSSPVQPIVNGKEIQKNTAATALVQKVDFPEELNNISEYFVTEALFEATIGSTCDVSTWPAGNVTLQPKETVVFTAPFRYSLNNSYRLAFQIDSNEALPESENFVGILPEYCMETQGSCPLKFDETGYGEITFAELMDSYKYAYAIYDKYYYYNKGISLMLPNESLIIEPTNYSGYNLVYLSVWNTSNTPITITGVSMKVLTPEYAEPYQK